MPSEAPTLATTASPASPLQQAVAPAPTETNEIPGFDKMNFSQQRYAQDQLRARRNSR
jgi:hypothetical protein